MSINQKNTQDDVRNNISHWNVSNIFIQNLKGKRDYSRRQRIKSFFQYYFEVKLLKKNTKDRNESPKDIDEDHESNYQLSCNENVESGKGLTNLIFRKIRNLTPSFNSITPEDFWKLRRTQMNYRGDATSQNSSKSEVLSVRKKVRRRLSQKSFVLHNIETTGPRIPSGVVTTISECLYDHRTIETNSLISEINLDLYLQGSVPLETDKILDTTQNETEMNLDPPVYLPREKHAKWKRSQMLRKAAADFDHEKWKSTHLLGNFDENITGKIARTKAIISKDEYDSKENKENSMFTNFARKEEKRGIINGRTDKYNAPMPNKFTVSNKTNQNFDSKDNYRIKNQLII